VRMQARVANAMERDVSDPIKILYEKLVIDQD